MLASALGGGDPAQQLVVVESISGDNVRQRRLAGGDRTRLVEYQGLQFVGIFERLAAFDEDAVFRSLAGPD